MSDTINNINTEGGPVIQGGTFFGTTFVAKQYVNAQPERAEEKIAIEAEEVALGKEGEKCVPFYNLVVYQEKALDIMLKLHELIEPQTNPLDIVKPIRAAMDAGIIRRPTWNEFCKEFGSDKLKSKSSLSKYTEGSYRYPGKDYQELVTIFEGFKI